MYSQNLGYTYGFHAEQGADPNSPEVFKQNLHLMQQHVATLREHTRRALAGIQKAYQVGSNPAQTQHDILQAKQTLAMIADLMHRSGIGSLPILPSDGSGHTEAPTETQLAELAGKGVQSNFEKLKRAQESAAVIANLLGSDLRPQKP